MPTGKHNEGRKKATEVVTEVCENFVRNWTERFWSFPLSLFLFPHEKKPPSLLLSTLQIVLFSLQRSFPPSYTIQCRVAFSTCWGLKACGIRLLAANKFKDSITVTRERAGRRRSHNTRCRCVIETEKERGCFLFDKYLLHAFTEQVISDSLKGTEHPKIIIVMSTSTLNLWNYCFYFPADIKHLKE